MKRSRRRQILRYVIPTSARDGLRDRIAPPHQQKPPRPEEQRKAA